MRTRFIRSSEKKRIEEELKKEFGIDKLPYLLLETGKEKIRGFSGSLSKEEIARLVNIANVELLGLYLIKREHDLRLSMDAVTLLRDKIKKNVIELTDSQFYNWIRGRDLEIEAEQGKTYVIKYKSYFFGCGKSNGKILFNYLPKDRRIRKD